MNIKKILSQFDYVLLIIVAFIFIIGIVSIASATDVINLGVSRQLKLQSFSFVLGLIAIFVLMFINYEAMGVFYKAVYVIGLLLLLLVYIPGLGVDRGGANSWIALGGIDFQTSEIAKLAYIIAFAKFLEKIGGAKSIKSIVFCLLFLAPYFVLVYKQPDLGSALVFIFATFGMMLVTGLKYRYIFGGLVGLILSGPTLYQLLEDHQRVRIDAFLNPNDLTLPGNYQVLQSKITLGSGQMYGKGLFQGVYHRLDYLPVQESDFIFAVFVEEAGFMGGLLLIVLFFIFLMRMIHLSRYARDEFGSNIIIGISFMFAFQIIENIAMTMGAMPVAGITLPFVSYGSTSVVSGMIAIGIIQSIYIRRKKGTFI